MKHFPLLSFIRWTQEREDIFSATCLCINMHSSPVRWCVCNRVYLVWVSTLWLLSLCGSLWKTGVLWRTELDFHLNSELIWTYEASLVSFSVMAPAEALQFKRKSCREGFTHKHIYMQSCHKLCGEKFPSRGFCHLVWSRQRFSDGWTKRKLHETEGSRVKNQQHKQCNVRQKPAVSNEAVQRKLSLLCTAHPLKFVLLSVLP